MKITRVLFVLFGVAFVSWIACDCQIRAPQAAVIEAQLKREIATIPPPEGAVVVEQSSLHKGGWVDVGISYRLDWTVDQLRDHYDRKLRSLGWHYVSTDVVREWGRDRGERSVRWAKGPYEAEIDYTRPLGDSGADYAFSLGWKSTW